MKTNLFAGIVMAAAAFLVFVFGAASSYFGTRPATWLHPAFRAAEALRIQTSTFADVYATNLWNPVAHASAGITRLIPDRAQTGYTLFTTGNRQGAALIDMQGRVEHEWQKDFYAVWPDARHLEARPDPEFITWRKAGLWPNGDLLAVYIAEGITPWGMGVVKLDRNSEVIWAYPGKAHHDFDVGPDGRIYLLTHEIVADGIPEFPLIAPPWLDDRIVILAADGTPLQEISIVRAFLDSTLANFLPSIPRSPIGDYLHANAIEVATPEIAAVHDYVEPGDVLVSLRQPGVIAAINPASSRATWARRGPWIKQHDPDFLANGNMLIFDNRGDITPGGRSRILEFDPVAGGVVWAYSGSPEDPLESLLRSSQQRLPNGNTLITESDRARLLEVTRAGDIVWEYVNPERGGPDNGYTPVLTWAERYLADQVAFLATGTAPQDRD